ncbi:hypothetical protein [Citrobacter braakii]|uniref:hypothetical protein n=1 Tax=Citrobacter braakii TaxID=57706 RepID=UPI002B2F8781|nr:hypothetical protein R0Q77_17570 [Citrobacter braakii]
MLAQVEALKLGGNGAFQRVEGEVRVALYFVNIFPQGNKSFCSASPHNRAIFIQWQTVTIVDNL